MNNRPPKTVNKDALEVSGLFLNVLFIGTFFPGLMLGLSLSGLLGTNFPFMPWFALASLIACVMLVLWERFVVRQFSLKRILIRSMLFPAFSFAIGCGLVLLFSWAYAETFKNLPTTLSGANVSQPLASTSTTPCVSSMFNQPPTACLTTKATTAPIVTTASAVPLAVTNYPVSATASLTLTSSTERASGSLTPTAATIATANKVPGQLLLSVDNPKPTYQKSKVQLTAIFLLEGKPVAGANFNATWHFKTKDMQCQTVQTDVTGTARCTIDTYVAVRNYSIVIEAEVASGELIFSTKISVLPV